MEQNSVYKNFLEIVGNVSPTDSVPEGVELHPRDLSRVFRVHDRRRC